MLEISLAREEHWSEISKVLTRVWEDDYVPYLWLDWIKKTEQGLTIIATFDGKAIATSHAHFISPEIAWLQGLRIDPDYQKRGFAGQIAQFVLNELAKRGFKRALAAIDADNIPSQKSAQRGGFKMIYAYHALQPRQQPNSHSSTVAWQQVEIASNVTAYYDLLEQSLTKVRDMVLLSWALQPLDKATIANELSGDPEAGITDSSQLYAWNEGNNSAFAGIYNLRPFNDLAEGEISDEPGIVMSPVSNNIETWPQSLADLEGTFQQLRQKFFIWMAEDDPLYEMTIKSGYTINEDQSYQVWSYDITANNIEKDD